MLIQMQSTVENAGQDEAEQSRSKVVGAFQARQGI